MMDLQVGETYFITEKVRHNGFVETVKQKMKLVGMYKHHAVLLNEYGYRESYIYEDLKLALKGTPVNKTWRRG